MWILLCWNTMVKFNSERIGFKSNFLNLLWSGWLICTVDRGIRELTRWIFVCTWMMVGMDSEIAVYLDHTRGVRCKDIVLAYKYDPKISKPSAEVSRKSIMSCIGICISSQSPCLLFYGDFRVSKMKLDLSKWWRWMSLECKRLLHNKIYSKSWAMSHCMQKTVKSFVLLFFVSISPISLWYAHLQLTWMLGWLNDRMMKMIWIKWIESNECCWTGEC